MWYQTFRNATVRKEEPVGPRHILSWMFVNIDYYFPLYLIPINQIITPTRVVSRWLLVLAKMLLVEHDLLASTDDE